MRYAAVIEEGMNYKKRIMDCFSQFIHVFSSMFSMPIKNLRSSSEFLKS